MGKTNPAFVQPHFRIRSGDTVGLNVDSGWEQAIDTNATIDAHVRFRIRFEVEETAGGSGNVQHQLEVKKNTGSFVTAEYVNLDDASLEAGNLPLVWVGESSQYADGDSTTNLLSGSSATFAAGEGAEDPLTGAINMTSEHTEFEFTIVIPTFFENGGQNVDGDTFEFRLVESDGTPYAGTYVSPVVTLNVPNYFIGGTCPESPHHFGPFADTNGNVYVLIESDERSAQLAMIKSDDNGVSWVTVDQSNAPTNNDMEGASVVQAGDTLHILHQPDNVFYHTFRMSDHATNADTWGTTDESVATVTAPLEQSCSLVRMSDGDLWAFYTASDGTNTRVRYKRRNGTWGTENTVDTTASTDFTGVMAIIGASNLTHIFYKDQTNGDLLYKQLTAAGTLDSSPQTVDNDTGTASTNRINIIPPVYYDDGGVEVIAVGYVDVSDNLAYVRYIRDGTLQTRAAASDNTVGQSGSGITSRQPWACLFVNNKTVYIRYGDLTTADIYEDENDDEGGWGTDTEEIDAITVSMIRGNVLTHGGGTVLAYIYEDGERTGVNTVQGGFTGGLIYKEVALTTIHSLAAAGYGAGVGDAAERLVAVESASGHGAGQTNGDALNVIPNVDASAFGSGFAAGQDVYVQIANAAAAALGFGDGSLVGVVLAESSAAAAGFGNAVDVYVIPISGKVTGFGFGDSAPDLFRVLDGVAFGAGHGAGSPLSVLIESATGFGAGHMNGDALNVIPNSAAGFGLGWGDSNPVSVLVESAAGYGAGFADGAALNVIAHDGAGLGWLLYARGVPAVSGVVSANGAGFGLGVGNAIERLVAVESGATTGALHGSGDVLALLLNNAAATHGGGFTNAPLALVNALSAAGFGSGVANAPADVVVQIAANAFGSGFGDSAPDIIRVLNGAAFGSGHGAGNPIAILTNNAANAFGSGFGAGQMVYVIPLSGSAAGGGFADASLVGVAIADAAGVGVGMADGSPQIVIPLSAAGFGIGTADGLAQQIVGVDAAALGLGYGSAQIFSALAVYITFELAARNMLYSISDREIRRTGFDPRTNEFELN